MKLTNKKYGLNVDPQNLPPELFYNCDKTFGHFIEDGNGYVVTDKNTPRDWFQYLCNDSFFSAVTNKGLGFTCYRLGLFKVTKYYEEMNYLPRIPNGARKILITDIQAHKVYDFFAESPDLVFTVHPGYVDYVGRVGDYQVEVQIFVPHSDPCECWSVQISNRTGRRKECEITFSQDWAFSYLGNDPILGIDRDEQGAVAKVKDKDLFPSLFGVFACSEAIHPDVVQYKETVWNRPETFTKISLSAHITMHADSKKQLFIVSGAAETEQKIADMRAAYLNSQGYQTALCEVKDEWKHKIEKNYCQVPDKNFQYFINVWLKNQLDLTYRYSRMYDTGYRDNMQDAWAYSLVNPDETRKKLLEGLTYMYPDGRCCRTYNPVEGHRMKDDFCDSPVWIPNTVTAYIKETGDFGILEKTIPYYGGTESGTVKEHILRGFELLWNLRGENGLVLMREGDWLDGLSGIQKYGDGATSAWCTVAAFWGQKQLAELFDEVGDTVHANLMRERNREYQRAFNQVAWDGKWYAYAFFEDGEPIGSSKNYEGKIYLNAQTWAIFSGIIEDKNRIRTVEKSIQRYLMTPFGCQLMEPPYVLYGDRCGRIHNQIPGTFANAAIYNHAASMKVFSDVARRDGDDAFDTFSRACPNHMDNSDYRRTSEPWCVGNVYYGPDHDHYGMNLFTWFTGAAGWLMQGGYTQILGVKADYHGIRIEPCVPSDWESFDVRKTYRGCVYDIHFSKCQTEDEAGIWIEGKKVSGNLIMSQKETCTVLVKYH